MINIARKYVKANDEVRQFLIDYYNDNCIQFVSKERKYRMSMKDNWCAMFASAVAHMKGARGDQFPFEVSCYYQKQLALKQGNFTRDINKVSPNDLILFDWEGRGVISHVGFITEIQGGNITTIEGNYKRTVGYRALTSESNSIHGFIINRFCNP